MTKNKFIKKGQKSIHCVMEDCINFSIWTRTEIGTILIGDQLNSTVFDNKGDFINPFNKCIACEHFIRVDNYKSYKEE